MWALSNSLLMIIGVDYHPSFHKAKRVKKQKPTLLEMSGGDLIVSFYAL